MSKFILSKEDQAVIKRAQKILKRIEKYAIKMDKKYVEPYDEKLVNEYYKNLATLKKLHIKINVDDTVTICSSWRMN